MNINIYLALAGSLLLLSVFVNQISDKFGIPSLLLFLGLGMLAGALGNLDFCSSTLTNHLGTVALVFILFNGGLLTSWKTARDNIWRGIALSTLGVFITAACLFIGCYYLLKLPLEVSLLISTIASSTDAPAVFSLLKMSQICLKSKVRSILEFESASNDPAAVLLTTAAIAYLTKPIVNFSWASDFFLKQILVGLAAGVLLGFLAQYILRRLKLPFLGLYPVFSISTALLAYSLPQLLGGSGYLSVYICGIFIGNSAFLYRRNFLRFNDSLNWIMQISMFLLLGLLVRPEDFYQITGIGLGISLLLILVARPLAVFVCLFKSEFNFSQQVLIAWAGLKGAVPIILATYPLIAHLPQAQYIFTLVFFMVLISVLLQGISLPYAAQKLAPPIIEEKEETTP